MRTQLELRALLSALSGLQSALVLGDDHQLETATVGDARESGQRVDDRRLLRALADEGPLVLTGFPGIAQVFNWGRTSLCPYMVRKNTHRHTQSMMAWDWLLPVPRTLNKRTSQTKAMRHSSTQRHRPDTPTDRRAI